MSVPARSTAQTAPPAARAPDLTRLLDHAERLAVPAIAIDGVLELLDRPEAAARHLAGRIERSPELALFAIRLATATRAGGATSVEEAVDRVGRAAIATMIAGRPTYNLTEPAPPPLGMPRVAFLRHSGEVARLSEGISRRLLAGALAPTAALAGLLHDIGRVIIAAAAADAGVEAPLRTATEERAAVGIDHPRLGAWLAERWGAGPEIVGGIAGHHAPQPPDAPVARSVWLAEQIAEAGSGNPLALDRAREACARCDLPPDTADQLVIGGPPNDAPRRPPGLTDREVQVLRMISRGRTAKQVALELGCSPSTVHNHLHHIYRKLGVSGQAQALLAARENNWV